MSLHFQNSLSRVIRWFTQIETWIVIVLVAFVIGFGLLQIVLRNLFSTGLVWGDTFLRHAVLWICLLGAARATAEGKHIHIDLLPRLLPGKLNSFIKIVANTLPVIVSIVLFYSSLEFVRDERLSGQIALEFIPFWWLELIFPFCFIVMTIRFAAGLIKVTIRSDNEVEA